jgi:hypothetical protein
MKYIMFEKKESEDEEENSPLKKTGFTHTMTSLGQSEHQSTMNPMNQTHPTFMSPSPDNLATPKKDKNKAFGVTNSFNESPDGAIRMGSGIGKMTS